jgi:hypothetical protein
MMTFNPKSAIELLTPDPPAAEHLKPIDLNKKGAIRNQRNHPRMV